MEHERDYSYEMIKNSNPHRTMDIQAAKLSARSGIMSKRILKQA